MNPISTLWRAIQPFLVRAAIAFMVLGSCAAVSYAQQANTQEDFDKVIQKAQYSDSVFSRMRDHLVAASRMPGLLLRTEAGGYISIEDDQVESLAAIVALRAMLYGTDSGMPYRKDMAGHSQLESTIDTAESVVIEHIGRHSKGIAPEKRGRLAADAADIVREGLLRQLTQYDNENRAAIAQELRHIDAQQRRLADLVAKAVDMRSRSLPSGAANGFLNKPGYYVYKVAGSGWRKRYGGYAHKIDGYQLGVLKVDDRAKTPKAESFHWTFPTGVDIRSVFQKWQQDTHEKTLRACKAEPPLCPCGAPPDIWSTGPEYTVLQGPFRSLSEAHAVTGDPYVANGKPGSNKHWSYDTERRAAELESACGSLGSSR